MKYGVIVIIVLTIFAGVIFLTGRADHKKALQHSVVTGNHAQESMSWPESNLKTYTDKIGKFSFQYPGDWILQRENDPVSSFQGQNYFIRHGQTVVTVTIPQDAYPRTNFTSAYITFATDGVIATEQACAEYTDYQQTTETANPFGYRSLSMDETRTIGDTTYYYAEMGDAAAGTRSYTRIYHVFRNDMCYEANLNLFVTNIGNYEPGAVTAVDEAAVWRRLEDVLATIHFITEQ